MPSRPDDVPIRVNPEPPAAPDGELSEATVTGAEPTAGAVFAAALARWRQALREPGP